jgi:glycosyltransferase involved in cell wall biosynthesis
MHYWQTIHRHCLPYVRRVINEADVVAANCEGLRHQAETLVPGCADRIEVIYNGCNTRAFHPAKDKLAVRRRLGLDTRSRLLLFCGSIIERKGIEELAQAWKSFASAHREWQLLAIGRVVDRSLARLLKEAGSVTLVGPVPHERVRMYMQAADAYIQPSRLEGLSNATMEAMATELPVIATDTNGQAELICNDVNGWLVPPGDAASLRAALEAAVEDPQRAQQFGRAARRTIESRFDPIKEAKRLAAILQHQAHRKRPLAFQEGNQRRALPLRAPDRSDQRTGS